MNPFVVPLLVTIVAPLLATRPGTYVKGLPLLASIPPFAALFVRTYIELFRQLWVFKGVETTVVPLDEIATSTVMFASAVVALQLAHHRLGEFNVASRMATLQLGMATLWFGSGVETLPISSTLGSYGRFAIGFVLVVIIPMFLSHVLRKLESENIARSPQ